MMLMLGVLQSGTWADSIWLAAIFNAHCVVNTFSLTCYLAQLYWLLSCTESSALNLPLIALCYLFSKCSIKNKIKIAPKIYIISFCAFSVDRPAQFSSELSLTPMLRKWKGRSSPSTFYPWVTRLLLQRSGWTCFLSCTYKLALFPSFCMGYDFPHPLP